MIVTAIHPKITFLQQLDRERAARRLRATTSSTGGRAAGVVKINCALDRLPRFTAKPELTDLSGGVELAHSVAYLETAFEEARARRPGDAALLRRRHADGRTTRRSRPRASTSISLFTQWVPHGWSEKPHSEELEAYADRVIAGYDELAPGFAECVLHARSSGRTRWSTSRG